MLNSDRPPASVILRGCCESQIVHLFQVMKRPCILVSPLMSAENVSSFNLDLLYKLQGPTRESLG